MKKLIVFAWLSVLVTSGFAQKTHSGFYFSGAIGPAWGTSNGYDNQGSHGLITGTGPELDFQVGASIMNGLILHGIATTKSVTGPDINGISLSNDYTLTEKMFGIGVTHYTPRNYFINGNVGIGKFSFRDNAGGTSTDGGFSILLKAGREWWVSEKLGLGAAFTYGKTILTSTQGTYTEKWNSNRFGVVFQFTID